MALPKLNEDLAIISKLGDYPGSDDNLTTEQFKKKFDTGALIIQKFLNDDLIPNLDQFVDVEALKQSIIDKTLTLSDKAADAKTVGDKIAKTNAQVKKARPYNHLDNSDFRNPVNQRGQTSYTGAGYSIDRWKLSNGTLTVNPDNITIDSTEYACDFEQNIENFSRLQGKVCTIAVKTSDGVFAESFNMGNCAGGFSLVSNKTHIYSIPDRHIIIRVLAGVSVSIEWAALYEGEYTIDTLPQYEPKGRKVEELNCGALNYDIPVTIASTSWALNESGAYYSIRDGLTIKAEDNPVIDLNLSNVNSLDSMSDINDAWGEMLKITTHDGYIVLHCASKPTVDIPLQIKVVR